MSVLSKQKMILLYLMNTINIIQDLPPLY